jgi:transitional endoplasmic reticulum ATPase
MADFQDALREVEPSTTREVYVEISETSWDDIGGMQEVKEILTESVEWPLRFPEVYTNAQVEMPRGILLSGPPGSGKTLLASAGSPVRSQFYLYQRPRVALQVGG